jgi:predicted Zn-dependent protease
MFGRIFIDAAALTFAAGGMRVSLPLEGLAVTVGGAGGRMLFFTHAAQPGWTLCTTDHAILDAALLASLPEIRAQAARIRAARKRSVWALIFIALFLVGGIWGLVMLKEPVVASIADRIPPAWERQLGDVAFSGMRAGKRMIEAPDIAEMLARITTPLLDPIPQERYPFTVHIMSDPTVNAFALPGGHIVLHTGLILKAGSIEEIAGVLAHEAAHVTLQHGLRQMIATVGTVALVQAFFGDATGLFAVLTENSALLLARKYSRDYERAADDAGWTYLTQARIDPRGMIGFFERLLENSEETDGEKSAPGIGEPLRFLSTHPTTRERISRLQERWKRSGPWMEYRRIDLDLGAFQHAVRRAGS